MKLFFALFVSLSHLALADFVYMKEDSSGKSILLKSKTATTVLSDMSTKNWALYPDITPDGNELIYAEGSGSADLSITYKNLKTNTVQKFHLPQKGMLLHPKFTRNGKFIFYSAPKVGGKNTIFFFDRAAEVSRQGEGLGDYSLEQAAVLSAEEESYFPRPSSDGNFVVYQRNLNGKKEIVFFDRIENKKTVIAEGMAPTLSFDERWIAYTSKVNGNWDIFVSERSTGLTIQATQDSADEMAPTFMPDNTLVFASNKSGRFLLYKLVNGKWDELLADEESKNADFYAPQFTGTTTYKQNLKADFIGNARSSFGTISHNGKVYMCGGHQGKEHTYPPESFSDQFIVYDPQSNAWTELAPRPARAHGYQLAAKGNYIYAFGGFAYAAEYKPKWKSLTQIDRYDIANNKWETIGHLFSPRSSNVAVTINDKVYIAAGWNSTPKFSGDLDGFFLDSIEIFDLTTEKLELAPYKLPSPVRRALTGVEYQGKLLLVGGLGRGASHFELLNTVTMIDPETGSFKELTPLPFATFAPAAGILGQELFVFGGMFKMSEESYEYVSHIYNMDLNLQKWQHTGRFVKETKGFSQVFNLTDQQLGVLGGHHYFEGYDLPVTTFEIFSKGE
jgi:N-acetylneuraminic acid mutarotase